MENFFIDGEFYSEVEDYLIYAELELEGVQELPDDYEIDVEESTLEPCFKLEMDWIVRRIIDNTDDFEDRFPEDSDDVFERIKKAITASVDLQKLNSMIPKLYYPNGKRGKLTKKDLLDAC